MFIQIIVKQNIEHKKPATQIKIMMFGFITLVVIETSITIIMLNFYIHKLLLEHIMKACSIVCTSASFRF